VRVYTELVLLNMATNDKTIPEQKLVVLQNGQRVSKKVHTTMEQAEAEKTSVVKRLQESKNDAAVSTVKISNLLLG
jgi:hypothetical protein